VSYYHIYFVCFGEKRRRRHFLVPNLSEGKVKGIVATRYMRNESFVLAGRVYDPSRIDKITIFKSTDRFDKLVLPNRQNPRTQPVEYVVRIFRRKKVKGVTICTDNFIVTPPMEKEKQVKESKKSLEKDSVFIVHGRDYKPIKELKSILAELNLKPIVLHEQPSGSRTIVEKLEKYSDVGYAFVILTPDDRGGSFRGKVPVLGSKILEDTHFRARQNVILELGYFMGKLGRNKVCCLYTGEVELPSDMHGIVYISFKESVNEARNMIEKELKEAGYEIKK
jgi:predicted nucleotide-binding protein